MLSLFCFYWQPATGGWQLAFAVAFPEDCGLTTEELPQSVALTTTAAAATPFCLVSSCSIFWLLPDLANSAATRMAFLMAFAFEDPWLTMTTPLMPSSGAPPYS